MVEFTNAVLQGVGIFFIILVNFVCIVRVWARYGRSFRADDGWLIAAYAFYMATAIGLLANGDILFRRTKFITGQLGPDYPEKASDNAVVRATFFFAMLGFWFALWSVKSSFLSLYKRMMIQIPLYIRLWWAVVVFCVLALAASVGLHFGTCAEAGGWFGPPGVSCSAKFANTTLWVSYAMDIASDIMIMLLPLTLVRNLQMSWGKRVSLASLFCLGFFVMICATIRAIQINQKGLRPQSTWTALWSIIEASVAIIVGCGPGLYCKANEIKQFRQNSTKTGDLTDSSLQAQHPSLQPGEPVIGDVPLKRFPTTTLVKAANRSDSQEELVSSSASARITIKKSFKVERTHQWGALGRVQIGDNA